MYRDLNLSLEKVLGGLVRIGAPPKDHSAQRSSVGMTVLPRKMFGEDDGNTECTWNNFSCVKAGKSLCKLCPKSNYQQAGALCKSCLRQQRLPNLNETWDLKV